MDYLKLGLLFSAFGCFFEVVFTSIYDSIVQYIKEGRKKSGYTIFRVLEYFIHPRVWRCTE